MPDESRFDGVGKTKSPIRVGLRRNDRGLGDNTISQRSFALKQMWQQLAEEIQSKEGTVYICVCARARAHVF